MLYTGDLLYYIYIISNIYCDNIILIIGDTYLPTYLPTYLHTYLTCIMRTCIHHAYIHIHTCIHVYIHAYMLRYIHIHNIYIDRVRTRPGNPGIYWNFENHISRPWNAWKFGPLMIISWKSLEFHPFRILKSLGHQFFSKLVFSHRKMSGRLHFWQGYERWSEN